ncbi:hypothetical protein NL676_003256 [Syzygium grande]|nr:hypothetical protein NL676_003256 [Syzygium grande]
MSPGGGVVRSTRMMSRVMQEHAGCCGLLSRAEDLDPGKWYDREVGRFGHECLETRRGEGKTDRRERPRRGR